MEDKELIYNQIEKYLQGEMDEAELSSFEEKIKNDAALQNEITFQQGIAEAALENDIVEFRQVVGGVIKGQSKKSVPVNSNNRKYYMIAASISLFLLLTWVISSLSKTPSSEQLYISYYTPYEDLISGRSEESADERISSFMTLYNRQQYSQAIEEIKNFNISDKPLLQLYVGICQLNIGNIDDAKGNFKSVSSGNSLLKNEGFWYLALAYLKNDDKESASSALAQITSGTGSSVYQEKAKMLIEEID